MKRVLCAFLMLMGISVASFAALPDDYITEMKDVMGTVTTSISTEMAKHMGFYTGDGNVTPVNTSGFLGLKIGLGLGVNTTPLLWKIAMNPTNSDVLLNTANKNASAFDAVAQAFGALPLPYDFLYVKIGIPVLPLDVGVRLGFIPAMPFDLGNGSSMGIGQFHFGLEGRYLLWEMPGGLIKVDARLSYDFDGGSISITNKQTQDAYVSGTNVGTSTLTTGFDYLWSGSSIGAKVMAGLNIPVVGGLFCGLGMNMNLGGVTTKIGETGTVSSLDIGSFSVSNVQPYSAFDMRLIGGFNLFVVSLAVEYNLFNGDLAINFIPFQMAF